MTPLHACVVYTQGDLEAVGANANPFFLISKPSFAPTAFALRRKSSIGCAAGRLAEVI